MPPEASCSSPPVWVHQSNLYRWPRQKSTRSLVCLLVLSMTQMMPVCSGWLFMLFVACQASGCVENPASEGNSPSSQKGLSAKGETDGNSGLLWIAPFFSLLVFLMIGDRRNCIVVYICLAVIRVQETWRCNCMMSALSEGSTDVYSPNVLTSNAANSIGPIKDGSAASDNQLPGCTTMYYVWLKVQNLRLVVVVLLILITGDWRDWGSNHPYRCRWKISSNGWKACLKPLHVVLCCKGLPLSLLSPLPLVLSLSLSFYRFFPIKYDIHWYSLVHPINICL